MLRSEVNAIRKELQKLQEKASDNTIRFRMKDGSIASIAAAEVATDSEYVDWVFNCADREFRSSDGAKLHVLHQMTNDTLNAPFVCWQECRAARNNVY